MILNILLFTLGTFIIVTLIYLVRDRIITSRNRGENPYSFGNQLLIVITLFLVIGAIFNGVGIFSNKGKMPVWSSACDNCSEDTLRYSSFDSPEEVNFFWLTDIIPFNDGAGSVGDLFLAWSLLFVIIHLAYTSFSHIKNQDGMERH